MSLRRVRSIVLPRPNRRDQSRRELRDEAATGGRLRLTIMRGVPERSGGSGGGSAVDSVRPSAGNATAPAAGWLAMTRAMWTAQS